MESRSVLIVNLTFDYGAHLRSIRQLSSQCNCIEILSSTDSESSLSSVETQSSTSTLQSRTQTSPWFQSETQSTQSQSQTASTQSHDQSQTSYTPYLLDSQSRFRRSQHQILPLPPSPSSSTPFIPAPVCSGTTLYGELANTVSAISMVTMFVVGGLHQVCSRAKRKLKSRTLKYACGMCA